MSGEIKPQENNVAQVEKQTLTAFRVPGRFPLRIVPAPADRQWMDVTTEGWANRCLPLRIANQTGWVILNDCEFEAVWGGKAGLDSMKILPKHGEMPGGVSSMFGHGVLTWDIPYLFRTPPGMNLLVRGPANMPKDGASAFEAIVETDWLPYPFTMNWRFLKPLKTVKFEKDEPICMILPVPRDAVERFAPQIRNLESEPELLKSYETWHERRVYAQTAMAEKTETKQQVMKKQGHYIRGEGHLGEHAHGHQTKVKVAEFESKEPPTEAVKAAAAGAGKSFLRRLLGR